MSDLYTFLEAAGVDKALLAGVKAFRASPDAAAGSLRSIALPVRKFREKPPRAFPWGSGPAGSSRPLLPCAIPCFQLFSGNRSPLPGTLLPEGPSRKGNPPAGCAAARQAGCRLKFPKSYYTRFCIRNLLPVHQ